MKLSQLCADISSLLTPDAYPWVGIGTIEDIIRRQLPTLGDSYEINNDIAVHRTARIDPSANIQAPAIIGASSFIGPHTLLRGGVYVGSNSSIGPGCEIKHSLLGNHTALAHFNFVGDSIIGSNVNFEAGAITANHYNEREDKTITVIWDGKPTPTDATKFGACIGDGSKIGANAVTSPGTILKPNSIVRRLELVEQIKD